MLSDKATELRQQILSEYDLSPAELTVLDKSLEALDTAEAAQREVERLGVLIEDRFGQWIRNPAVGISKDARAQVFAGFKQLGLADPYGGASTHGRGAQKGRRA